MSIYPGGCAPNHNHPTDSNIPGACSPRSPAKTPLVLESIRGDIGDLISFACGSRTIPISERTGGALAAAFPDRMPGREFNDKYRAISELRRINMCIYTDGFFPIWLPTVEDIADRIVARKRQYQGAKLQMRKRDISNALRRAPLHPDMGIFSVINLAVGLVGVGVGDSIGWIILR